GPQGAVRIVGGGHGGWVEEMRAHAHKRGAITLLVRRWRPVAWPMGRLWLYGAARSLPRLACIFRATPCLLPLP
ncbi:hypothetical protein, partial [Pseudacidovorax intermedius]|uniref:hypothetical protein n=1 Tax=Pseudacidovorax intermedius TaxID=433924 RepID=UPI001E52F20C